MRKKIFQDLPLKIFKIIKISQTIIANSYFGYIAELRNQLQSSDVYEPLEVKKLCFL